MNDLSRRKGIEHIDVVVKRNYYRDSPFSNVSFHESGSVSKRARLSALLVTSDAALWGGGTCLYEATAGELSGVRSIHRNIRLFRMFGKPYFFLGAGIGDIKSPDGYNLIESIIKKSAAMWFRDEQSLEKAAAMVPTETKKFFAGGDPSFLMHEAIAGIVPAGEAYGGVKIGFCGVHHYKSDKTIVHSYAECLRSIIKNMQAKVYFIPFHQGDVHDHEFHEEIAGHLPRDAYELVNYGNASEAISLFRTMNFIIGIRLHSVIMADMLTIPNIAVEYAPKVRYYVGKTGVIPQDRLYRVGQAIRAEEIERIMTVYPMSATTLQEFISEEARDAGRMIDGFCELLRVER